MKYIIIDDEPLARTGIKLLADQIPELEFQGEFPNPILAQSYINNHKNLDLIFLDIEMPGLNGIQYLRELRPEVHVILTTAYSQYALEAFELEVIDYLLKPVKMSRFLKAINKAKEFKKLSIQKIDIKHKEESIFIKSNRKYVKLKYQDILYIKGLKDYVIIHTSDQKHLTAMNIGTIHKQLPQDIFARVSKSYLINEQYIDSVDVDSIYLSGVEIPLGSTYREGFLNQFIKKSLLKR